MKNPRASLVLALLLAGCGSSAAVVDGAPPADAAPADVPGDVVSTPIVFPSDDLACATSDDCCTVANACGDGHALVTAKNREATAAAFAALAAQRRAAHDGGIDPDCWPCVAPAVEVSCQAGRCVAERVFPQNGWDDLSALIGPHCGSLLGLDGGTSRRVAPIRAALSLDAGATPPAQPPVTIGQPPVIGCH